MPASVATNYVRRAVHGGRLRAHSILTELCESLHILTDILREAHIQVKTKLRFQDDCLGENGFLGRNRYLVKY